MSIPAGFTRTKRPDWYSATFSKVTECAQTEKLACPDGTTTISVWYDVHSKTWVVQTLDGNGWDTGPTEYWFEREEAFRQAALWAGCPH